MMHVKQLRITGFKRFADLTVRGLPPETKLVVLTGPNGSGKSSLFDAFKLWYGQHCLHSIHWDDVYYPKAGATACHRDRMVSIEFHDAVPEDREERKKALYVRSAYRNDPDFTTNELRRMNSTLDCSQVRRMIDNDSTVSENYQRLVSASVAGLYGGDHDAMTVLQLRESVIGQVRTSMGRVFSDLTVCGLGDPLVNGAFYFEKGASKDFHYKNLSGGEKAAFDLILDFIIKRGQFDNTLYAIDEPEAHMHSRLQGSLLAELVALVPDASQLWIATHSVGMMRKARELKEGRPNEVVFLDFGGVDLDSAAVIEPEHVGREFWLRSLGVALDDLAELVAPSRIVLCEGELNKSASSPRSDFDARCYRRIFRSQFPETEFISAGSSTDLVKDRPCLWRSLRYLFSTMDIVRVVDRDDKNIQECSDLEKEGVKVLSKRNLESYLLHEEILKRLCIRSGKDHLIQDVLEARRTAIENSVSRGNPRDDLKSASGEIYTRVKGLLQLPACGNDADAFMRDTMAPLIEPDTETYADLRYDIFGV